MNKNRGMEFTNPNLNISSQTDGEETGIHAVDAANKIEKLIYTDILTGFENRQGFEYHKKNLEANRYSIIFISFDLDNLKKINDNPDFQKGGHKKGDEYILSFVNFVNKSFRTDDPKFRLGGDEFLIIIKNINSNPQLVQKISERINQQLEVFNSNIDKKNQNKLEFTYGIGIATSKEDINAAIERSDSKLVEAKENKKSKL
jgi:diguanylate cyclase (GGDEF)-like protein